jgi:hypothetical protein
MPHRSVWAAPGRTGVQVGSRFELAALDTSRMKVTNDIHTRPVPGFAEEMAVRRLETAVRNADRVVPAPPSTLEPAALAQLSTLAFRILRGF